MQEIRVIGIEGMPEVTVGDDLVRLILDAAQEQDIPIEDRDILVVTQKIISKAEGRIVHLDDIQPSAVAVSLSEGHHRDPRHTEIILRESKRIVRMDGGNIISETHHGFNCANAGVDASNLPAQGTVALLPIDPDASAEAIRNLVHERVGKDVAVVISDTFGRPWREGAVNVAIGVAGINPLQDYRGEEDSYGRLMRSTVIAVSDELAATAELVTGKVEGIPVALIKGYAYDPPGGPGIQQGAKALIRPPERDMFR